MKIEQDFSSIKAGVILVLLFMLFGISMGVGFGTQEEAFKNYISEGVDANPQFHDEKSKSKIWRYAQRAHFHSTGITAMSLGLLAMLMFSNIKRSLKPFVSILIGLGGVYPFAWFFMFLLSPSIGRSAAHGHILTELATYIGVLGLLSGVLILLSNMIFGVLSEEPS